MRYWVKSKSWMKWLFPNHVWKMNTTDKKVYLTFDDGPTPEITHWVLEQLKTVNAKATFFCIGHNIEKYPEIFNKILSEKHAIGNHTFNHLNGWKTATDKYVENVLKSTKVEVQVTSYKIQSENREVGSEKFEVSKPITRNPKPETFNLFRPPFGKIKPAQSRELQKLGYKIIMWDVISYDFDQILSKEKCLENVLKNIENGSIIVFHDSKKAWKNLEYVLPKLLKYLNENGYSCEKLT